MAAPYRYFVINQKTDIMHIFGQCQHTKPRTVAIRLFDSRQELEARMGRPMRLCTICQKALQEHQ